MPFVNKEVDFNEFMSQLHQRIQKAGNREALVFFECFLKDQLPAELTRRASADWDGSILTAGDFDVLYPIAVEILHDAATRNASEAHLNIYEEANAVSLAFCEYLNELFQCSGEGAFDFIPVKSYSQMMAEAGFVELKKDASGQTTVSLTEKGETAVEEVKRQINGGGDDSQQFAE
ncbi:MAG: hypothetical protein NTY04_03245 [Candidatus Staskawiczbacteria bacterium]|nr:hypothetical protein [Candidatus Staskawiczbacteria bacterium]